MKGPLNPPLKVGDIVFCYHMDGETSVPPGTKGKVTSISRDPFEPEGELIYNVEWENGSSLGLLTSQDAWKKVEQEPTDIQEQSGDPMWDTITKKSDIFENFDWKWLENFLYKLRDTGIINMLGSSPLLYSGSEHIDRYYGEGREDDEEFQELLEDADEAKDKIIQGVVNYMVKHNKDLDNMDLVNQYARKFSKDILMIYISLSGVRHEKN
jgi:hypothetical protein